MPLHYQNILNHPDIITYMLLWYYHTSTTLISPNICHSVITTYLSLIPWHTCHSNITMWLQLRYHNKPAILILHKTFHCITTAYKSLRYQNITATYLQIRHDNIPATLISQQSANSNPPPTAKPSIAAIVATGSSARSSDNFLREFTNDATSVCGIFKRSFRSAPVNRTV